MKDETLTADRLSELEQIRQEATKGPWRVRYEGGKGYGKKSTWTQGVVVPHPNTDVGCKGFVFDVDWTEKNGELWEAGIRGKPADFEYIAAFSPETTGALLEEAREAEELRALFTLQSKRMGEAMKAWRKAHPGNDLTMPDLGRLLEWLLEERKP